MAEKGRVSELVSWRLEKRAVGSSPTPSPFDGLKLKKLPAIWVIPSKRAKRGFVEGTLKSLRVQRALEEFFDD